MNETLAGLIQAPETQTIPCLLATVGEENEFEIHLLRNAEEMVEQAKDFSLWDEFSLQPSIVFSERTSTKFKRN